MKEALQDLIQKAEKLRRDHTIDWETKPTARKWSKKEIMGHLVDSAIHNLQRFVEVQFENKPYEVIGYRQDDWVKINAYQDMPVQEIFTLWLCLNHRIINVISHLHDEKLAYQVKIDNRIFDLAFLIRDYIRHMQHHLNQIKPVVFESK